MKELLAGVIARCRSRNAANMAITHHFLLPSESSLHPKHLPRRAHSRPQPTAPLARNAHATGAGADELARQREGVGGAAARGRPPRSFFFFFFFFFFFAGSTHRGSSSSSGAIRGG